MQKGPQWKEDLNDAEAQMATNYAGCEELLRKACADGAVWSDADVDKLVDAVACHPMQPNVKIRERWERISAQVRGRERTAGVTPKTCFFRYKAEVKARGYADDEGERAAGPQVVKRTELKKNGVVVEHEKTGTNTGRGRPGYAVFVTYTPTSEDMAARGVTLNIDYTGSSNISLLDSKVPGAPGTGAAAASTRRPSGNRIASAAPALVTSVELKAACTKRKVATIELVVSEDEDPFIETKVRPEIKVVGGDIVEEVTDKRWAGGVQVPKTMAPSNANTYDVVFMEGALGCRIARAAYGFANVTAVSPGGQAARGGVMVDDVISAVNGRAMDYDEALPYIQRTARPLTISFHRDNGRTPAGGEDGDLVFDFDFSDPLLEVTRMVVGEGVTMIKCNTSNGTVYGCQNTTGRWIEFYLDFSKSQNARVMRPKVIGENTLEVKRRVAPNATAAVALVSQRFAGQACRIRATSEWVTVDGRKS